MRRLAIGVVVHELPERDDGQLVAALAVDLGDEVAGGGELGGVLQLQQELHDAGAGQGGEPLVLGRGVVAGAEHRADLVDRLVAAGDAVGQVEPPAGAEILLQLGLGALDQLDLEADAPQGLRRSAGPRPGRRVGRGIRG